MSDSTTTTPSPAPAATPKYDPTAIYWSPSKLGFYDGQFADNYIGAGVWPSDAKVIDRATHAKFASGQPGGMVISADTNGDPQWVPAPAPTAEQTAASLVFQVETKLNAVAATWGYTNGIDNATTWASSSNPQFAAEAQVLHTWRDQVWVWVASLPNGVGDIQNMPPIPTKPVAPAPTPSPAASTGTGA